VAEILSLIISAVQGIERKQGRRNICAVKVALTLVFFRLADLPSRLCKIFLLDIFHARASVTTLRNTAHWTHLGAKTHKATTLARQSLRRMSTGGIGFLARKRTLTIFVPCLLRDCSMKREIHSAFMECSGHELVTSLAVLSTRSLFTRSRKKMQKCRAGNLYS